MQMSAEDFVVAAVSFARMGDAVTSQAVAVLVDSEPLEAQNGSALRIIRRWFEDHAYLMETDELEDVIPALTAEDSEAAS